jgi:hypothetical protein
MINKPISSLFASSLIYLLAIYSSPSMALDLSILQALDQDGSIKNAARANFDCAVIAARCRQTNVGGFTTMCRRVHNVVSRFNSSEAWIKEYADNTGSDRSSCAACAIMGVDQYIALMDAMDCVPGSPLGCDWRRYVCP